MKSTDELKSEIYIHTQGLIEEDVSTMWGKEAGKWPQAQSFRGRVKKWNFRLFKLVDLFKISLLFIWQIETRLCRRFFFVFVFLCFFFFFFWGGGGGGSTLSERVFHCTPVWEGYFPKALFEGLTIGAVYTWRGLDIRREICVTKSGTLMLERKCASQDRLGRKGMSVRFYWYSPWRCRSF